MNRYDALHIFLDESGKLAVSPIKEALLVGGVLVFGPYEAADDDRLRDVIGQQLTSAGGRFPADLHYNEQDANRLPRTQLNSFLQALRADVPAWAGSTHSIHGIAIRHESDLFDSGPGLLREAAFDNRYIAMMWALVEHLLFVDDRVAARLNPGAKVHLHLASREYHFEDSVVPRGELEALGFKVTSVPKKPGWYRVPCSLRTDEVRGMVRIALRRWAGAPYGVDRITIESIDYHGRGVSPAGLYLADLYLGQIRHPRRSAPPPVLNDFCTVEYGRGLELAARKQSALVAGDLDGYMALLASGGPRAELDRRQERRAAELLGDAPEKASLALEEACREVDLPGRSEAGLRRADAAGRLLRQARASTLRTESLELQARLSYANHTGDVAAARGIWSEFEAREPRLPELGAEGLRLKTEMRVRRAVGLMDTFDYDGAVRVMTEIGAAQEQLHHALAAQFHVAPGDLPSPQLGMCYSALGQALAFRGAEGDAPRAEAGFRTALALFTDAGDQERDLVYLGHLACDQGAAGRALWDEVSHALSELDFRQPARRAGGQYVLALQLKGVLCFASTAELEQYLAAWSANDPLSVFEDEALAYHPFGLIHQALALCGARAWRSSHADAHRRLAIRHFEAARAQMSRGGTLLKTLALVCRLRQHLFEGEVRPEDPADPRLYAAFRQLEASVLEHFESHGWGRDAFGKSVGHFGARDPGEHAPIADRASRLIEAVRFNYW